MASDRNFSWLLTGCVRADPGSRLYTPDHMSDSDVRPAQSCSEFIRGSFRRTCAFQISHCSSHRTAVSNLAPLAVPRGFRNFCVGTHGRLSLSHRYRPVRSLRPVYNGNCGPGDSHQWVGWLSSQLANDGKPSRIYSRTRRRRILCFMAEPYDDTAVRRRVPVDCS